MNARVRASLEKTYERNHGVFEALARSSNTKLKKRNKSR